MKLKLILTALLLVYLSIAFFFLQSLMDMNKYIQTNQIELQGLAKIQKIIDIEINLQRERGISIQDEVDKKKLSLIYNTEPQLLKDLESLENKEIQQGYLKLLREKAKYTDHENFEKYTALINMCTKDIYRIVDKNKLVYENDKELYNLFVMYAQDIPNIEEKMAKVRGFGSKALSNEEMTEYDHGAIDVHLSSLVNLSDIINIKFGRIDQSDMGNVQADIHTVILEFTKYSKRSLSSLHPIAQPNNIFFIQSTSYIDGLLNAQKDISSHIDKHLDDRIRVLTIQRILYIIFLILFTMLYFLFLGFFIKKMKQLSYNEYLAQELNTIDNLLNELSNHENNDMRKLCKTMLQQLSSNNHVRSIVVYLIDEDNNRLMLAETWGKHPNDVPHFIEFGEGIIGEVGIQKEIKYLSLDEEHLITVPLIYFDDLVGVIEINTIKEDCDANLLERELGIFSKYLYRVRQISKNKNFLKLLDQEIIISKTDRLGLITYASAAFEKISGYSKEELIGKSHNIIRHPDMPKSLYENLWSTILAGKVWQGEIKNIHKSGSEYWVSAIISPNFDFYGEVIGFTAIREHITDKKKIEELSIKDPMTNLYNRRGITSKLQHLYDKENNLYMMLIDVDNFKLYNDNYGHDNGDKVLIAVANEIHQLALKTNGFAFRFGGEEFLFIFPAESNAMSIEVGNELIHNVKSLHIKHQYNNDHNFVTISAGLTKLGINDFEEMYKKSDELLYKAKHDGRNRVCY